MPIGTRGEPLLISVRPCGAAPRFRFAVRDQAHGRLVVTSCGGASHRRAPPRLTGLGSVARPRSTLAERREPYVHSKRSRQSTLGDAARAPERTYAVWRAGPGGVWGGPPTNVAVGSAAADTSILHRERSDQPLQDQIVVGGVAYQRPLWSVHGAQRQPTAILIERSTPQGRTEIGLRPQCAITSV